MTEDKAVEGVVMSVQDRYNEVIEEGSLKIKEMTAQLSMNMWSGMGVIHDVCEDAYQILVRAGAAGPGRKKEGLVSMGKTYQDLASKTGLKFGGIKKAHVVFKKTQEITGLGREEVPALPITPKGAEMIVSHGKLQDQDKEALVIEAIQNELADEKIRARILDMTDDLYADEKIFRSTLWDVKRPDPRFGEVYPGRLPGQIAFNVLYHYTDVDDFCLFPFVGSGTEADVAKYMQRDYLAWDITEIPTVAERHKGKYFKANSVSPWRYRDIRDQDADLVFMDPPRFLWGDGRWEDSSLQDAFSRIDQSDIESFIDTMDLLAKQAYDALKYNGKLVLLLRQPGFIDIPNDDLTMEVARLLSGNYELVRRMAVTFPMNMYKPENPGEFVSGFMDMLVLEKR